MAKTIKTQWDLRTYDVWGNKRDGYDANDSYWAGSVTLQLTIETANVGTDRAFDFAFPSDRAIQRVFGVRCKLDISGDDIDVYINRESDGFPIGEMHCTSHESLSPIRAKE